MIENAHSTPGPKNRAMQSSSVTFVFCFTPGNKIQNTYISGTCIIIVKNYNSTIKIWITVLAGEKVKLRIK